MPLWISSRLVEPSKHTVRRPELDEVSTLEQTPYLNYWNCCDQVGVTIAPRYSMSTVLLDIRYALRQMRLSPGFTITAILTLGIGIGATTGIFTLIHSIMLKSLPVTEPSQLYRIGDTDECCNDGWEDSNDWSLFSYPLVQRFAEAAPEFEEVTAFQAYTDTVGVRSSLKDSAARPLRMEYVDGRYFHVLGIGPYAGRLLQLSDDQRSAAPVAVMSYSTWQQSYGSDPSLIGSTFIIEGHPVTLVGIAPPGFFGDTLRSHPPDFWIPVQQELLINGPEGRTKGNMPQWLYAIGRLKPGASVQGLDARLTTVLQRWLKDEDEIPAGFKGQLAPTIPHKYIKLAPAGAGVAIMKAHYRTNLRILLLVCLTVLLIACANIANLLLARSTARRGNTAIRMALGASRPRLMAQQLTEAVTLAVCGGVLGLVIAYAGARIMLRLAFPAATRESNQRRTVIASARLCVWTLAADRHRLRCGTCVVLQPFRSRGSATWSQPNHKRPRHSTAETPGGGASRTLPCFAGVRRHAYGQSAQPAEPRLWILAARSRCGQHQSALSRLHARASAVGLSFVARSSAPDSGCAGRELGTVHTTGG